MLVAKHDSVQKAVRDLLANTKERSILFEGIAYFAFKMADDGYLEECEKAVRANPAAREPVCYWLKQVARTERARQVLAELEKQKP